NAPPEPDDMKSLFDEKPLDGWDGDSRLWSVKDGVIRGVSTTTITDRTALWATWPLENSFGQARQTRPDSVLRFFNQAAGTENGSGSNAESTTQHTVAVKGARSHVWRSS
ncbi:MAG: hypothetical protein ACYTGL_29410, partial [Planctomycetota bacterium]